MKILRVWEKGFHEELDHRQRRSQAAIESTEAQVRTILTDIRNRGDEALIEYTARFDCVSVTPEELLVPEAELTDAWDQLSAADRETLAVARERIETFHREERNRSWMVTGPGGEMLGQLVVPLERAGIYVPGGKAAYPSSVFMNAIPARVAGVSEIVMVTPPSAEGTNPLTLAAAHACRIKQVYRVGGAQAIAALAYGTATIPAVDKIVGPGNVFVAVAKKLVCGEVGIDMVAGPSEITVIADESANPDFIAADLLSQAEHDEEAKVMLVTPFEPLAEAVRDAVESQLVKLPRQEILKKAIDNYGCIIVTNSLSQAVDLSNKFAPEHLLLAVQQPISLLGSIKHAGSVFLGHFSPVAAGDYLAGPNHVLPTSGTARFSSPLGVYDFVKHMSITHFDQSQLQGLGDHITRLARLEGLEAHARSVEVRL
jgi:histidinol dehydrogenase